MYHSPFHLIDPAVFDAADDAIALKRRLGLEKRKLLAEFELAGTPTIILNGREFQRQDISDLFDEFGDTARLALHLQIWKHKAFLRFLETAQPESGGDWLYPVHGEATEQLLRFVSPHYAEALNRYLQRCLQGQDDTRALLYELRADDWVLPAHQEDAYRYPTRFFTEKKNELMKIRYDSEQRQPVTPATIRNWCSDQQIHVLNRLPDRFDHMRYELAERLNNLCVLYDRRQAKKLALAAIERSATIRVNDEELERLVPANLRIIRNKNGTGFVHVDPETGRRRVKMLPLIGLLFLLVRLLSVGNGCLNFRSPSDRLRDIPNFEVTEQTAQDRSFSALIQALDSPEVFRATDTVLQKPIQLSAPRSTGDDPLAPLFADLRHAGSRSNLYHDSASFLLRNRSTQGALFALHLDTYAVRSVYVRPGESYRLRYALATVSVHLIAGDDWSDSVWNSYKVYHNRFYGVRQTFRGGFRTRVPISNATTADGVPMFTRTLGGQETQDTISLHKSPAGKLVVYYNLGSD